MHLPWRVRPLGSHLLPVPRKCHKSGQGARPAAARRRPRSLSRAASPRLPACPAHPLPLQTCPGDGARGRGLTSPENFASFSASSCPRLPARSPLPAAGAVGGSGVTESLRRRHASHGSSFPAPRACREGGGEWSRGGRGESESSAAAGVGRRLARAAVGAHVSAAAIAARLCTVTAAIAAAGEAVVARRCLLRAARLALSPERPHSQSLHC